MTNRIDTLPGFRIRPALPADVPEIRYLHHASLWCLATAAYTPLQIDALIRRRGTLDRDLVDGGTYYLVEIGGEIAGCGGWSGVNRLEGHAPAPMPDGVALIRAVYVHPKWARRGVGTRLMRHVEAEAVRAGRQRAELLATLTGVPLYASLAYADCGTVRIDLGAVELPAVRMRKMFMVPRAAAAA